MILVLLGTFIFSKTEAQQTKPITLQNALQLALDSNLVVRSAAYSVEVQRAMKGASWDIPKLLSKGNTGSLTLIPKTIVLPFRSRSLFRRFTSIKTSWQMQI